MNFFYSFLTRKVLLYYIHNAKSERGHWAHMNFYILLTRSQDFRVKRQSQLLMKSWQQQRHTVHQTCGLNKLQYTRISFYIHDL